MPCLVNVHYFYDVFLCLLTMVQLLDVEKLVDGNFDVATKAHSPVWFNGTATLGVAHSLCVIFSIIFSLSSSSSMTLFSA